MHETALEYSMYPVSVSRLSGELVLGGVLEQLTTSHGGYELLDHWQQGEFHHDVVVRVSQLRDLPGPILVIATNCNGGVKEVLCFESPPDRWALWHHRCPQNPEFAGETPQLLDRAETVHHFDPCALLVDDARSELLPEHRSRMRGGGWCKRG